MRLSVGTLLLVAVASPALLVAQDTTSASRPPSAEATAPCPPSAPGATNGTPLRCPPRAGAWVGVITPDSVAPAPVRTFSELLTGRLPDVVVQRTSGSPAAGSRVILRGATSMLGTNGPLLLIDGVRAEDATGSLMLGVGGQQISRLEDLDPFLIDRIEVLPGPAAAARLGGAAGGALAVTTLQPGAGAPGWRVRASTGGRWTSADFPASVAPDSSGILRSLDVLSGNGSPIRRGAQLAAGTSVRGGLGSFGYALGGDYRRETGALPRDGAERTNLHAAVRQSLPWGLELGASGDWHAGSLRLPQGDNSSFGIVGEALLANPVTTTPSALLARIDTALVMGTRQEVRRRVGSVALRWSPLGALRVYGRAGVDATELKDGEFFPGGGTLTDASLARAELREDRRTWTAGAEGTVGAGSLRLTTTVELQRLVTTGRQWQMDSVMASPPLFARDVFDARRSLAAVSVEEQMAWGERAFLDVGARRDRTGDGPFGVAHAVSPWANARWLAGSPGWARGWIDDLALRAAYGRTWQPLVPGAGSLTTPILLPTLMSSLPPTPERVSELEGGIDASLPSARTRIALTVFRRQTTDLYGFVPSRGPVFGGGGRLRQSGLEAVASIAAVRRTAVEWTASLAGALARERVISLPRSAPPSFLAWLSEIGQIAIPGQPLGVYWGRAYAFTDANGNGAVDAGEITPDSVDRALGSSTPTRLLSLENVVRLGGRVRFGGLLDYRGGYRLFNATGAFQCEFGRCAALHDPSAALEHRVRAVAAHDYGVLSGFVEKADFLKLRELWLSYELPRAGGARLTLAGRNLATWTNYSGLDPELNYAGSGAPFARAELLTMPDGRSLSLALELRR